MPSSFSLVGRPTGSHYVADKTHDRELVTWRDGEWIVIKEREATRERIKAGRVWKESQVLLTVEELRRVLGKHGIQFTDGNLTKLSADLLTVLAELMQLRGDVKCRRGCGRCTTCRVLALIEQARSMPGLNTDTLIDRGRKRAFDWQLGIPRKKAKGQTT